MAQHDEAGPGGRAAGERPAGSPGGAPQGLRGGGSCPPLETCSASPRPKSSRKAGGEREVPSEPCVPHLPRAVRSAAGALRGGSSPAPPSPGFPQAKAIKRVIRLLKMDVNNGEEAAVTAVRRGRSPPRGRDTEPRRARPDAPGKGARCPGGVRAAVGGGGSGNSRVQGGDSQHASGRFLCFWNPSERTGQEPGQRGLCGEQASGDFKPRCSLTNPRHKRPHRGSNLLSAQTCIKGVFPSWQGLRDVLTPVGTFISSPARSAMCKQPHRCMQPSPPLGQQAQGVLPISAGWGACSPVPHMRKDCSEELDTSSADHRVIASNVKHCHWSQMLSGQRKRKIPSGL